MEIKVKHILVGLVIVILAIVGITFIYKEKEKLKVNKNIEKFDEKNQNKIKIWDYEDSDSLVGILAQKNGDWSKMPLTDNFMQKYNEKDGIFGDMQFDKIEYFQDEGDYYFATFPYLIVTQGLKKTAYVFNIVARDGLIDSIKFFDVCQLTDENGNEIDYRQPITEENYRLNMIHLTYGGEDEKGVGVTPHFHKKYPYFLDLFIHYSPLDFNEIYFDENKSSWEKKEAYFEVDSTLECIKRHYLVKFTLDDKGYLDDAEVKCVGEYPYEGNSNNDFNKVFYRNSNWDSLKLTDKFKKKFNNKSGIFPDIEQLDNNFYWTDDYYRRLSFKNGDKGITVVGLKYKDGKYRYYRHSLITDENDYIDDVIYEKLPYEDMSIEEVKEAYLKDYSQN